jgi:hypothetical protein
MKNYCTLLLLLIFSQAFSQTPQIKWAKCLGGSANDRAYSNIQTSDSGYLICGFTNSVDGDVTFNHGDADGWIVKTDVDGNILWQKTYGGSLADIFRSIIPVSDSTYIVCGETSSVDGDVTFNHGMSDFWVVEIDQSGNIIWQRTYGGSNIDFANDIVKSDSGFFVVGQTFSADGDVTNYKDNGDAWFISIDSVGNLIDQKTKGGHMEDLFSAIIPSIYGGFMVCGNTFSNDGSVNGLNHGGSDAWLVKLSKYGTLQWTQCYGGINDDGAYKGHPE